MIRKVNFSCLPAVRRAQGFTLIELMITMFVSSVIVISIITAFLTQQRLQSNQDQVVEMQQSLRSAMNFLADELRMAGYDPVAFAPANAGIVTATGTALQFTLDRNANGVITTTAADPAETIQYALPAADDADNNGVADTGSTQLGRQTNLAGGFQPVADNIAAIEFLYVLPDTSDNGIYDPPTTLAPTAAELNDIRAITVSMLARAGRADPDYFQTRNYITGSGAVWAYADNFRRRLMVTTIQLRNMGL